MFNWFWKLLYNLAKTILYCIDFILDFAKMLAGIEPVTIDGKRDELTTHFLTSESVLDAFKLVALIGIVLLFLFTAFSVVRSIGRFGEGKSAVMICMDMGKALLYLLLIPAIMIIGSAFISAVMTSVYDATAGAASSLGGRLFTLIANDAYDYDGLPKEEIMSYFSSRLSGYDYYSNTDVALYFDRSNIDYFLAFVGCTAVLILLIKPMLTFVERTVSLVILFIVAPLSISSVVLDDGMRFKLWREQVINKFLVAYGALITLNIFVMLVEIVYEIEFFTTGNADFKNGLARMLFVIGGAAACKQGTVLIGNLVNNGAGSQHAQDQANTIAPFMAAGHMAHHLGSSAARGIANSAPARSLKNNIGSAVHRKGNARRSIKDEAARNKIFSEETQKYSSKMDREPRTRFGEYSRNHDWRKNLSSGNQTNDTLTDIRDILRGSSFSGGAADSGIDDNATNQRSAGTIVDAMGRGKTKTEGGGNGKA